RRVAGHSARPGRLLHRSGLAGAAERLRLRLRFGAGAAGPGADEGVGHREHRPVRHRARFRLQRPDGAGAVPVVGRGAAATGVLDHGIAVARDLEQCRGPGGRAGRGHALLASVLARPDGPAAGRGPGHELRRRCEAAALPVAAAGQPAGVHRRGLRRGHRLHRPGRTAHRPPAGRRGSPLLPARQHPGRGGHHVAGLGGVQDHRAGRADARRHRHRRDRGAGLPAADLPQRRPGMSDLSISGLDAGYGGQPIISGFNLPPLTAGEVVSVVGPNGAGKSTLLRSLAGLIPAHGSIRLDEAELTRLSLADRAKRVTYMPQTLPQGVALTVLETVVASIRATPLRGAVYTDAQAAERAYEVLQRINAEALAGQRLDRLSGGQKQLAGLAQALAREPRLLLLDEPTSALDLHYQLRVLDLAREAAAERGMTVMIV